MLLRGKVLNVLALGLQLSSNTCGRFHIALLEIIGERDSTQLLLSGSFVFSA